MKVTEKIKNKIIENVRNLTEEELKQDFIYFSIKTGNKLKQTCTPGQNKRQDVVFIHATFCYSDGDFVKEITQDIDDYNTLQDCKTDEEKIDFLGSLIF